MRRAVHIDFHTMPGIEDLGKNCSGASIARTLADAHVDCVNIFARCNIGFSYYPTKLGTPYPGLDYDLFGDTLKECRARGIEVVAYLNGGLNHLKLAEHPEWRRVRADGSTEAPDPLTNNFFRAACFNTGYRDYLKAELREILTYQPDGLFVDCMIPRPCYCPACTEKAAALELEPKEYNVVLLREVIAELRGMVPQETRMFFNSMPFERCHEYQSHVELECLPTDGLWGYDYFPAEAPYYRNLAPGKDRLYMTGRMVTGWGDFSGSKPLAALENDVFDALMYGYVPSVGDLMHPRDGLDQTLYRNVGKIYERVMELEPWTYGAKPICEAAVLRNLGLSESDKGVARMLSELKICYDVVTEEADLSGYRMVILPDEITVTETLAKKLADYQGFLLSSGESIAEGGAWDYIDHFERDKATDGFYRRNGEVFGQCCPGVRMTSDYATVPYIESYFDRHFDGKLGYLYIPPKGENGCAAVAQKGNRVHICFKIFKAYMQLGASFHKELIKSLLPSAMIGGELPSSARATLMECGEGRLLQIKADHPIFWGGRGIIQEHTDLPAGRVVTVEGAYKAFTLPDKKPLVTVVSEGRTAITLPEIHGYLPILLKGE
ncbi:MAG: hypothetical protein IJP27_03300 [Clostridia bacterium]|nr:hypothetical protein [Clostridia bacterium]